MAIRTIRRNGRNITIDTKTGKEVKPGTRPLSFARRLARRLKRLPGDMVTQAKAAKKDIGDNLVYSSKTDKKGKPLTIAQAKAVKTPAYRGPGGNPNKSGEGQAQQRSKSKSKSTATTPVKAKPTANTANTPRPTAKANPQPKSKPKQQPSGKSIVDREIAGAKTFISTYKGKQGKEGMQPAVKKMEAQLAKLLEKKKSNLSIRSQAQKSYDRESA